MNDLRKLSAIFAVAMLVMAGCQSEMPATGKTAQTLSETCTGYGFKRGTDAFAACMLQLDQQRIAENRQRRQAIGAALSDFGEDMQQSAAGSSVNCTSTRYKNIVRTNCY